MGSVTAETVAEVRDTAAYEHVEPIRLYVDLGMGDHLKTSLFVSPAFGDDGHQATVYFSGAEAGPPLAMKAAFDRWAQSELAQVACGSEAGPPTGSPVVPLPGLRLPPDQFLITVEERDFPKRFSWNLLEDVEAFVLEWALTSGDIETFDYCIQVDHFAGIIRGTSISEVRGKAASQRYSIVTVHMSLGPIAEGGPDFYLRCEVNRRSSRTRAAFTGADETQVRGLSGSLRDALRRGVIRKSDSDDAEKKQRGWRVLLPNLHSVRDDLWATLILAVLATLVGPGLLWLGLR